MSKTRKNMLRSSFVMLLVALISLSSATFAWFTSGNAANVTDIEFTAEAASGIQISVDAISWKTSISASEIKTAQPTSLVGTLTSLSSAGVVNNGVLDIFEGKVENGKITTKTAVEATAAASGYYKFDLYFKNDGNVAKTLSFDLNATDGCTVKAKTGSDKGTQNCVRIAAVHQGIGTLKDGAQTEANVKAAMGGTTSVIWEPNAKTHTENAKTYRYAVAGSGDGAGTPTDVLVKADTAYPYVGIKGTLTDIDVYKGSVTPVSGKTQLLVDNDKDNSSSVLYQDTEGKVTIGELQANKITKITIYIWVEGQDVDCENNVAAGGVVTNLKFIADDKT